MPQARTTGDVGGLKEILHGLELRCTALVVQEVTHRFPGWSVFGPGHRARDDLDRASGGDR